MKRIKQTAGILLSLILVLGLFLPIKVQASGNVTISVSSSTVNVGETVTVTAWASGPNGEAAIAKLGFNYDSGKFSFVSCSESEYTGGSDGYVGVTGNNVSITLKATASGTASVTVSGSGGVSVSDGTVEYGELSAGGTKLTINNGSGTTDNQQNNSEDSGNNSGEADNANKSGDNSLASLKLSQGTLSPTFQYSETNYTATVAEDVTSVTVDAKPSNDKAVVESITGQDNLQPGKNTISIVVKAENGSTVTYKVVVTRGGEGAVQDTPEENQEEVPKENPEGITIDGNAFDLSATVPEELIPQDFTKITMACQGQQVEGLQFDKGSLLLVYLTTPSTEVKNTLAVYDEAGGTFYPFRKVEMGQKYFILLNPPTDTGLSQEYTYQTAAVEGFQNVPVFVNEAEAVPTATGEIASPEGTDTGETASPEGTDTGETPAQEGDTGEAASPEGETREGAGSLPELSLVYGASSNGNIGWYQYDSKDGFFQRYVQTAVKEAPQETDSIDNEAAMQGLQNSYKDLEEQLKEKKSSSRKTTAILVFVIAVLIVVIINLILRGKLKDDDEDTDVFVDDTKPRRSKRASKEIDYQAEKTTKEEMKKRGHKPLQHTESEQKKRNRSHIQETDEREEKPKAPKKMSQETRTMVKPELPKKQETPEAPKNPGKSGQKDDFEVIDLEDL